MIERCHFYVCDRCGRKARKANGWSDMTAEGWPDLTGWGTLSIWTGTRTLLCPDCTKRALEKP